MAVSNVPPRRGAEQITEHAALRDALGDVPSVHAAYRFTIKLRAHSSVLEACLDRVLSGLREAIPDLGAALAIDGSDLLHAAVCTRPDLPIAWHTASACDSEHEHMPGLLDTAIRRGRTPGTCAMDKGYDGSAIYATHPAHHRPVKAIYHTRGAVEREFGVLKHEWGMLPLRVCRLPGCGCMWT